MGLHTYKGLWQGVTAGDFNNNGYPDLLATNWGENNFFRTLAGDKPLRSYYGDFNRNRRMDMIVSYYEESAGKYVPMNKLRYYESIEDILRRAQKKRMLPITSLSE